jgi:hypothetical protein
VFSFEGSKERSSSGDMELQNVFKRCSRWLGEHDWWIKIGVS